MLLYPYTLELERVGRAHSFCLYVIIPEDDGKEDVVSRVKELAEEHICGRDLEIYNVEYRKEDRNGNFGYILTNRQIVSRNL